MEKEWTLEENRMIRLWVSR